MARRKVERNAQIVADRVRGLSWRQIGNNHEIDYTTAREIYLRETNQLSTGKRGE